MCSIISLEIGDLSAINTVKYTNAFVDVTLPTLARLQING